jgi:hypothetical protein
MTRRTTPSRARARPVTVVTTLAVLFCALGGACQRDDTIRDVTELVVLRSGITQSGFGCMDANGNPFFAHDTTGSVTVVVDFFAFSGFDGSVDFCPGGGLPASCQMFSCQLLPGTRWCTQIRIDAADHSAVDVATEVEDALHGMVVSPNAPSGNVLVRVVATAQPCEDLAAGQDLDCTKLVGCASTCPFDPQASAGPQPLELITSTAQPGACAAAVLACASADPGHPMTSCAAAGGDE